MKILTVLVVVETHEEAYQLGYHLNESAQKFLKERFDKKPSDLQWSIKGEETNNARS